MMNNKPVSALLRSALVLSCLGMTALPSLAQDHSRVSLLPGRMMEDGRYLAGVRIELAQGWKTYWRAPGSGGIPPQFDWNGSQNLVEVETKWPTPTVFETYGMRSIGYDRDVIFPVLLAPAHTNGPMELQLTLDYGVCSDICIPARATISGQVELSRDLTAPQLEAALSSRARIAAEHGITADCHLAPGEGVGVWQLSAEVHGHAERDAPIAVVEIPNPDLWVHDPQVTAGAPMILTAGMDWFGAGAFSASRDDIRITLLPEGERAIEIQGC
ncbi:hypothetical protein POI8812_00388 [Pontivivens insulae]|uniref:Thiol:disulfide interchange protein DsbD N-terminal domain-containing protein n=2 Tax=Pontivivens insulae TaxID=1639689 RepID=A0A2R8A7S6_9RHOB|nr:disulfide bond corrector protein DsbC [Pontivivens insulae]SPF28090.1 hypothetical protein POI8812_00388 [Pontivivens insulae]